MPTAILCTTLAVLIILAFVRRDLKRAKQRRMKEERRRKRELRRLEITQAADERSVKINDTIHRAIRRERAEASASISTWDPLFERAARFIVEQGYASSQLLTQTFAIPDDHAVRLIAAFERCGIVGSAEAMGLRPVRIRSQATLDDVIIDELVRS